MHINERDQINFHGFLKALREMHGITQERVSKGICTVSGMNRFENGNRNAEKLMRDRLTARLGISGEKYEDYLQPKEYVRWEQRLRIVKAIENRELQKAKQEIEDYKNLDKLNRLNIQFIETMYFQILAFEGASDEELLDYIKRAVKRTVPNVKKALAGEHLLADQEVNLIAELMRLIPPQKVIRDEKKWRISEYEKLISCIENSQWEKLLQAKVYPKVAYYIGRTMLEKENAEEELRRGLELCHNAIELLRDCSRLYYFIELTETRRALATRLMSYDISSAEKSELEEMLQENNQWEMVFKELYAEYKVEPYMSNFCYLYYENESHNMVEVIEARRTMMGISRVRLSEGICADRTIVRFEREGNNPNVEMVRCLFERMGMCAEYRRTRVVTNDVNALMLSSEVSKNVNNSTFKALESNLNKLKKLLCMDISHNKQEITRLQVILNYKRGKIGQAELYDLTKEALEYTLPVEALTKRGKKYLTRNELLFVHDFAFKLGGEIQKICFDIIESYCTEKIGEEKFFENINELELFLSVMASYLGDKEEYEKSNNISELLLKECLINRRMGTLSDMLYNKIWNNQMRMSVNNIVDNEYIRKSLSKCAILCEIDRKYTWQAFFQNKLSLYI